MTEAEQARYALSPNFVDGKFANDSFWFINHPLQSSNKEKPN